MGWIKCIPVPLLGINFAEIGSPGFFCNCFFHQGSIRNKGTVATFPQSLALMYNMPQQSPHPQITLWFTLTTSYVLVPQKIMEVLIYH